MACWPKHSQMECITTGQFEYSAQVPVLLDDEIHLWLLAIEGDVPPRAISALAHAHLGRLLQAYAGNDGSPPSIGRGEHGKPFVIEAGYPHFNLSHAGRCVVFGFSRTLEIGVDVETFRRRRAPLSLAERFFAAEETRVLAALDVSQLDTAFVRLWTSKEAVLKALGRGIAFGLHRLCFSVDADGRLLSIADEAGPVEAWRMCRFEVAGEHVGALAWRGPAQRVRALRMTMPTASALPSSVEC